MNRPDLKRMCLEAFAQVAVEHPARHQGEYAARYVLYSRSGERIELMFEKGSRSPANAWFESRHAHPLHGSGIEMREYPAAAVVSKVNGKKRYSRHSALMPMTELRDASLVKARIGPTSFE